MKGIGSIYKENGEKELRNLAQSAAKSYFGVSNSAIIYIIRSGKSAVEEYGLMDLL